MIDILEQAEVTFVDAISSTLKEIPFTGLNQPLYHFTDGAGLDGILRSRSLWASLATALDDPSEIRYALSIARGLLQRDKIGCEAWFSSGVISLVDPLKSATIAMLRMKTYVVSFRTDLDATDHWDTYGRSGTGAALAFAPKPLVIPGLLLIPVLYNPSAQTKLVRDFLESAWQLSDELLRECPVHLVGALRERVIHWTALGVWILAPLVKDPDFCGEQEWRLVVVDSESIGVQFGQGVTSEVFVRKSRDRDVPYKRLQYAPLPIVGLELGQSSSMSETDPDLAQLLRDATGGMAVPVTRSSISGRPKSKSRPIAGYAAAGGVLAVFQVVVSPQIGSIPGILVGWVAAYAIARLAYNLVTREGASAIP